MSKNQSVKLADRPVEFAVNGEEVSLTGNMVREFLVRGEGNVSDQEVVMFIQLCKYQKLNPFLNEAYLVKFGSKPAQIIVSKEAFMKRAEAHEQYNGMMAGIIVEREGELVDLEGAIKLKDDKLVGGWAEVYRKDRSTPVTVKISYDEFSKGQATWKSMPMNMIRKTAVVNALREAFPDNVGAMYTEEEELPSNPRPINAEVRDEIKENANKEVIDFEEPKKYKNQRGESITKNEEAPMSHKEVKEEQENLFNNLEDLEKQAPAF